jgi:hypothetical protein
MASEEKSVFEELAPFARMVVVPGVTVGNLVYSNQQDLYSSSAFAAAAGAVAANTQLQFFTGALNESAVQQGYTAGTLSISQTNSKFSKGQAPANQVYIATHAGFLISKISTLDLTATPNELLLPISNNGAVSFGGDVFSVGQNFSWDLTIGRGITRTIGTLSEYNANGAWAVRDEGEKGAATATTAGQNGKPGCQMQRLQVPIVFPPLVNVGITAANGSPFQLLAAANVQVRMILKGYLMTMPVG